MLETSVTSVVVVARLGRGGRWRSVLSAERCRSYRVWLVVGWDEQAGLPLGGAARVRGHSWVAGRSTKGVAQSGSFCAIYSWDPGQTMGPNGSIWVRAVPLVVGLAGYASTIAMVWGMAIGAVVGGSLGEQRAFAFAPPRWQPQLCTIDRKALGFRAARARVTVSSPASNPQHPPCARHSGSGASCPGKPPGG